MMSDEEIKKYLPKYLSAESYEQLLNELKSFPENIDSRLFTSSLDEKYIYQGDGLLNMPTINLLSPEISKKETSCIVLSNTCDVSPDNKRFFTPAILYAPIITIKKYIDVMIAQKVPDEKIRNHINLLKQQKVTQLLYLPSTENCPESIVFLDRIFNVDLKYISQEDISKRRLFSLSNYGFYILLFKLSVHFSRIQEKVDRNNFQN